RCTCRASPWSLLSASAGRNCPGREAEEYEWSRLPCQGIVSRFPSAAPHGDHYARPVDAWTDAGWLAGVRDWLDRQFEALGLRLTGAVEQPHVRPWSTVLRIPTTGGDVWFKANIPLLVYEAAVVDLLAAPRPDCVPGLLATDLDRGWMLMADG